MLQHYKYPFKVWLTSVFLGSLAYFLYDWIYSYNYRSEYMVSTDPSFLIIITGISLVCSVPCLILFTVIYNCLMDSSLSVTRIKLILFIISEVAIIFWMYMLIDGSSHYSIIRYLQLILPFALVIGTSIYFYRIEGRGKELISPDDSSIE